MPRTRPQAPRFLQHKRVGRVLVCVGCALGPNLVFAQATPLQISLSVGVAQRDYAENLTPSGSGTPVSSQEKGAIPLLQWQVQWQSGPAQQLGQPLAWQASLQGQHAQGHQTYQGYWQLPDGSVEPANDRRHQQTQHSLRLDAGPLLRLSPTWQWGPQLGWQYQHSLRNLGQYTERFNRQQLHWGSTLQWQASPQLRIEWQHTQNINSRNRLTAQALGFSEVLSPSRQREQRLRLHWAISPHQGEWQLEVAHQSQTWGTAQAAGTGFLYPGATERQTRVLIGRNFVWQ